MLKIPSLKLTPPFASMALLLALLLAASAGAEGADEEATPAEDPAGATELRVTVHGTGEGGIVNWALYSDEVQHDSGKQMRGGRQDAAGDSTTVSLGPVAPGRYSVAVFLDVDGDGEFDQNFFGIPKEPFGFSNDVLGAMGKPSFEIASFEVGANGAKIEMTLNDF